jgi:hypothetical protein
VKFLLSIREEMNEQQKQQQEEKEKSICDGGVHFLKLEDKEHSTQFIHLIPVSFRSFDLLFSLFIVDKLTMN